MKRNEITDIIIRISNWNKNIGLHGLYTIIPALHGLKWFIRNILDDIERYYVTTEKLLTFLDKTHWLAFQMDRKSCTTNVLLLDMLDKSWAQERASIRTSSTYIVYQLAYPANVDACAPCFCMCPANTNCLPNVGLTLAQRLRRWPNISPTLGQRLAFAEWGLLCWLQTESPVSHFLASLLLVRQPSKTSMVSHVASTDSLRVSTR